MRPSAAAGAPSHHHHIKLDECGICVCARALQGLVIPKSKKIKIKIIKRIMELEKKAFGWCDVCPPSIDTDTPRTQVEAGACVQAEECAQLKRC